MISQTGINYNITIPIQTNYKIKHKIIATTNQLYTVINYDKHVLCNTDVSNGLYRSIIFSYPQSLVLSFSPPKTVELTEFMKKYPTITNNIIINEYIEGVMIQLFFDYRSNSWEIATKCNVGGKYYISGKKTDTTSTFYEMFLDALCVTSLKDGFFDSLQKDMSYTFILQHPKNVIVLPVERPCVFLIAVYKMFFENRVEYIPSIIYEGWNEFKCLNNRIEFPKHLNNITEYSDLIDSSQSKRGFVFTNIETGERAVLELSFYIQLKTIQSIKPNVQYQYLCLKRINKVAEYLAIFPGFTKQFNIIREHYEEFMSNVYHSYMNFYVYKNTKQVLEKYRIHIKNIHHTIYLPNINTDIVSRKTVRDYFDKMEPSQLLYILNGDNREPVKQDK